VTGARAKKPGFGKVFAKAASSWTSLGVAGSALVAGAALMSWPLVAIGGVAYAALVGWDLANPDFWKRALGEGAPEGVAFPNPDALGDADLAQTVRALLAARAELARVLVDTPADLQGNLAGALVQVTELERQAALLVKRGGDLGRYLGTVKVAQLKADLTALETRLRGARDAEARTQYEAARAAKQEQMRAVVDIDAAHDRVQAQLATIVATLEALPAKIIRMRALDAQAVDELSGNVKDELAHLNGEVRVFEETLRTLAEVTAP
jgi:hypothetical protein